MDENKKVNDEEKDILKSWSIFGSPGSSPTKRFIPTKEQKLIPISEPIEVKIEWFFTDDQFSILQLGHEAHEMEDKWNIYMDDSNTLHFYRSWTGSEIFKFTFQKISAAETPVKNAAYKVSSLIFEGNKEKYNIERESDAENSLYEVMKVVLGEIPLNVIGE